MISEQLAYAFFFFSSVFFSTAIVYETWKGSRPLKEIDHQNRNEAFSQEGFEELAEAVRKLPSSRSALTFILGRLRGILVQKITLRLGITRSVAEELLENPQGLRDSGYEKLTALISRDSFMARGRSERMTFLRDILDQLEEN
jgi:hypothetical protein